MSTQTTICPNCRLPKESQNSGTMTQWLTTCRCALRPTAQEVQGETIDLCINCGKRVRAGRKGSFTQFIFRSDLCDCDVPQQFKSATAEIAQNQTAEPEVEEEELEVDADKFPLERYKPIEFLGKGADGTVYFCRDRLLRKLVTVKTLHVLEAARLVAFQREAQVLSKLDHPNIVRILDFGATTSGAPYMVLDYTQGETLDDFLHREGTLNCLSALHIFSSLAAALDYCHSHGVYHRDLKPGNILMTNIGDESTVKLFDFGVAEIQSVNKEAQHATIVGTPSFMSPDQAKGLEYDARSEVYAFGCVLFNALTNTPPFRGDTALEILSQHANNEPPELAEFIDTELPNGLQDLVSTCLAKEPENRFQSMKELNIELRKIAQDFESQHTPNHDRLKLSDSNETDDQFRHPFDRSRQKSIKETIASAPIHYKIAAIVTGLAIMFLAGASVSNFLNNFLKIDELSSRPLSSSVFQSAVVASASRGLSSRSAPLDPIDADSFTKISMSPEGKIISPLDFSDEDFPKLLKFKKKLRSLGIAESMATGTCLKDLNKFPKLEHLVANTTSLDDRAMKYIGEHQPFSLLILDETLITDSGLKELSNLRNLESLSIKGTNITDAGLVSISNLPSLRILKIDRCRLVEGRSLQKFKNLKALSLSNCRIDNKIVAEFRALNPYCRVTTSASTAPRFGLE